VADLGPAADRGTTTIADRVVAKIATIAARDCTESTAAPTAMGRLAGRSLPDADAVIANGRTRLRMRVAVRWPTPLGDAARQVHDRVRDRVAELTGLQVDAVDVDVEHMVLAPDPAMRRIR
jgi:uncharacterized alkaline shock family protein YloU